MSNEDTDLIARRNMDYANAMRENIQALGIDPVRAHEVLIKLRECPVLDGIRWGFSGILGSTRNMQPQLVYQCDYIGELPFPENLYRTGEISALRRDLVERTGFNLSSGIGLNLTEWNIEDLKNGAILSVREKRK